MQLDAFLYPQVNGHTPKIRASATVRSGNKGKVTFHLYRVGSNKTLTSGAIGTLRQSGNFAENLSAYVDLDIPEGIDPHVVALEVGAVLAGRGTVERKQVSLK